MKRTIALALSLALALLAAPPTVQAQQIGKPARIGLISRLSPSETAPWYQVLRQGLRQLGWIEGKNIGFVSRHSKGRRLLAERAAQLLRLKPDVIVVHSGSAIRALRRLNKAIPIVMAGVAQPLRGGFVKSLARPGGNVTGLSQMAPHLAAKRLELLKELVPQISRVAVLWAPKNPTSTQSWKNIQAPARKLGLQLQPFEIRGTNDFEKAFKDAAKAGVGAVFITSGRMFGANLNRIAELAAKGRLPSIWHRSEYVDSGGLASYGPDRTTLYGRAATFVHKILKGAKPADLPVEQPTKFDLVINLKTARALGFTFPRSILLRADRVIE